MESVGNRAGADSRPPRIPPPAAVSTTKCPIGHLVRRAEGWGRPPPPSDATYNSRIGSQVPNWALGPRCRGLGQTLAPLKCRLQPPYRQLSAQLGTRSAVQRAGADPPPPSDAASGRRIGSQVPNWALGSPCRGLGQTPAPLGCRLRSPYRQPSA